MSADEFDAAYYATNYPDYARQNPPRKFAFYRRWVERTYRPDTPRRIHDVGCAFGWWLAALDSNWDCYGSDVSRDAIARARQTVPQASLAVAPASTRPFAGPMGIVTAFDVLEHLDDLDAAGQALRDQLAPGGALVFVVPVYDGLSGPIIRRLDRDPTHRHKWPRQAWLDWAQQWFTVEDWQGIVRWLPPWRRYIHWPTRWARRHAPAVIVTCRRSAGEVP